MADPSDDVEDKLSLSRPFGRRKKRSPRTETAPTPPAPPEPPPVGAPADAAPDVVPGAPVDVPSGMPAPDDATRPDDSSPAAWETGPALDSGPIPGFVPPLPPSEDEVAASTAPPAEPAAVREAAPRAEPTDPDPVEPPPSDITEPAPVPAPTGNGRDGDEREPEPWRQRVDLLPMLTGRVAAIVAGIVVGLLGAALTFAGLKGCSELKGTASCGGPGFFLLLAIVVVMVLLGAVLLTVWEVSRPGSTSILGVALVGVISQLFLVDVLFSAWMFAVIPALSAIAFLGAWWLTSSFAEETT
ncbi:hypothetical protein [Nocardioides massiliensis]|uniref:Uncharacterized protein n=1 Tax=Nocardioides massiliensis TaxID=1325935 RepID=A0ABT9NKQ8_9ACTN|nr:hypothetical protein [Nocardioides massiliensis]MDP9820999.1 hypothetical protein [Nocardioides massiliensis]